jgi:hypothetical protein
LHAFVKVMMTGIRGRLLGLCLPPLVFCAIDNGLTALGQSASYWAGNYHQVNEASPTFNHLLQIHPAAFVAGAVVWAMVFVVGILLLPDVLALITSIVVTFGHAVGAVTWLMFRFHYGYQMSRGLFLASSAMLGAGIYWGWQARPVQGGPLLNRLPLLRWILIVILSGTAMYLFLWPRTP